MKREPLVYALLLVATLALAFRTWTHEARPSGSAVVEPWHEATDDIVGLEYTTPGRRLDIRRLGEGDGSYLWATADTAAFVVGGEAGGRLLETLAAPQALRDLGRPGASERRTYGLDTARTRLVVRFRRGSRELRLGGAAPFTGERYVLDTRGGHVYALPSTALADLDDPAQALPERRLHAFGQERVAAATLRAAGRTRTRYRLALDSTLTGNVPGASAPEAWVPAPGAKQADPRFTTFMQRVQGLWAAAYAARENPAALEAVLRLDYADRRGRPLGFLELFRRPGATPEYFARSELTRVLVRLTPGTADALAADVAQGL